MSYGDTVRFVCVCCAGPELAAKYASTLSLRTCINTWVDGPNMPKWGQLGCNGLIVFDGSGRVVCRSSPAYLDVQERAFEYVETLLAGLLGEGASTTGPQRGSAVRLVDLISRADLNGREAVCTTGVGADGRCTVDVGGQSLRVKASNLVLVPASDGGCSTGGRADDARVDDGATSAGGCADGKCALPKRTASGDIDAADARDGAKAAKHSATVHVVSVKVAALDAEHEACAQALEALGQALSPAAARKVLAIYESHFVHEEALLDTHLYQGCASESGFSADAGARRSHYADHSRLVKGVARLLEVDAITPSMVDEVMRAFEDHADKYDGAYADRLSASLGVVA